MIGIELNLIKIANEAKMKLLKNIFFCYQYPLPQKT